MSDDLKETLVLKQMQADILLKSKQATWETPKNIALLVAALAASIGAVGGVLGYQIGKAPTQPPINIYLQPPATH